jgi:hypothetical protein
MQILRADETNKSVAQIASLEEDENHENNHNRRCGERRQEGRENALQDLHRPRRRLVHFNLEWMIYRLRRLLLCGLPRSRDGVFSDVVLEAVQGVGRLLNHAGAKSRTPDGVKFLANLDLICGKAFTQLRGLSADDSAQDP